ncbi:MAG: hypothetical protein JWO47_1027 [Candidatus Saccharibacteria bacterium]|nr:hypothetical protein [Candidatus Saccharibacteria bacterium]
MHPDDYLNKEDETTIYFFSSPYDVFNNWSAHTVTIWGKEFNTAEHAYHYKKFQTTNPAVAEEIFKAPSPWACFQLSRKYKTEVEPAWNDNKLAVMETIIRSKMAQNEDVVEQLQKTGKRIIAENSPWDNFWGLGSDGTGENSLGKIWMKLRSELSI